MDKSLNLLITTWDVDGLSICESTSDKKIKEKRERFLFPREECVPPHFFELIRDKIKTNNIDIIVISTQNESNNSYYHPEYLPNTIEEIGYLKLSYKSYKISENKNCRVSVYCKNYIYKNISYCKLSEIELPLINGGAVVTTLKLKNSVYTFVNVQAGSIFDEKYSMLEQNSIFAGYMAISLVSLLSEINNTSDKIFLFGEFGTSINTKDDLIIIIQDIERSKNYEKYFKFDSMSLVMEFPSLSMFKEGNKNIPNFPPTWPMIKSRSSSCSKIFSEKCIDKIENKLGWPNRIFYNSNDTKIKCIEYTSTNDDSISSSNSNMVIGIYSL